MNFILFIIFLLFTGIWRGFERACLPKSESQKIKLDLESEIASAMENDESLEEIIEKMGYPDEINDKNRPISNGLIY